MSNQSINLEGFVLGVVGYRESDAMVTFLSRDYGLLRFVIRGFYKPKSKMGALGLEFSYVRYQSMFQEGRLNTVIGGDLLESYRDVRSDYNWLVSAALFSEVVRKTYDETLVDFYIDAFDNLFQGRQSVQHILVRYLSALGIQPMIEHCVFCESQTFVGFSIEQGGFLCAHHAKMQTQRDELLAIYRMFQGKPVPIVYEAGVFKILIRYFEYHNDIIIRSYELI